MALTRQSRFRLSIGAVALACAALGHNKPPEHGRHHGLGRVHIG